MNKHEAEDVSNKFLLHCIETWARIIMSTLILYLYNFNGQNARKLGVSAEISPCWLLHSFAT